MYKITQEKPSIKTLFVNQDDKEEKNTLKTY